ASRVEGESDEAATETGADEGVGKKLQRWLLTGVSYMIPFVAGGGLLIALGFLLAGYDVDGQTVMSENSLRDLPEPGEHALFGSAQLYYLGALMSVLGGWAFSFL